MRVLLRVVVMEKDIVYCRGVNKQVVFVVYHPDDGAPLYWKKNIKADLDERLDAFTAPHRTKQAGGVVDLWKVGALITQMLLIGIAHSPVASAAQPGPSEAQQRLACIGDAFRLCASFIPDRALIRACLGQRRAELSEGCRSVYDASVKAGQ